ncbi:MAG TPA: 3'(2'),5'-bisphosphate nucleotidase CysQ [Kangiella sp.]
MDTKIFLEQEFVNKINKIAIDAGKKIMAIYEMDFDIYEKKDESPLTEADLASHHHIINELVSLDTGFPILSEESADIDWSERQSWQTYWLIDPLDGTKEFIKKNGEFTVNIALVHQNRPILGVVYAPAIDVLYYGSEETGAWKLESGTAKQIKVSTKAENPIRVVGSRSHQSEAMEGYLSQYPSHEMIPMGSSLKLCLVAEGKADLYPRLGPTCEWDTAAAHAIVNAAGGYCVIYDEEQKTETKDLTYNTKESLLNPYFIVKGPEINV